MSVTTSAPVSSPSSSPAAARGITALQLDTAHSHAQFGVRHMLISTVRGTFEKLSGTVALDEGDLTHSNVDIVIDANSISSREPRRDAHLRSADFFDVEHHPTIRFHSTNIESAGKEKFRVTGDLTIRGITKPVTLDVVGPTAPQVTPWGVAARGVSATGRINRKDWGLNWNAAIEAGGFLVGDEVELTFETELIPVAQAQ